MQLRVLGTLELVDDNATTIPFRGAQFRRALSTLSVHAPGSTPVDVLKDVLWPQGAPSPNALQALMSKLRKAIAPIEIDANGSAYTLVLGHAEIDAHRFERLVTAGREAAAAGRHDDAAAQLGLALEMWRDRPFEDIADLPIGQAPAARLGSMRVAAVTLRLESLIGAGRIDVAAAELESLVVADPLVERWWALLMIAHYRQDRQAEALRTFQRARAVLADELGLEPGPELRELEARILQHDPTLGPSSTTMLPRVNPQRGQSASTIELPGRLASFIGRFDHIEALVELLDIERLISITGPGGAGRPRSRSRSAAAPGGDQLGPESYSSNSLPFHEAVMSSARWPHFSARVMLTCVPQPDRQATWTVSSTPWPAARSC